MSRFIYRSLTPEGRLWCESMYQKEVVEFTPKNKGYTFQVCEMTVQYSDWELWIPNEQNTKDNPI